MRRQLSSEPHSPWDVNDAFEFVPPRTMSYEVEAEGARETVAVVWSADGPHLADVSMVDAAGEAEIIPTDDGVIAWRAMRQRRVRFARRQSREAENASSGVLHAPMPGRLSKLFVNDGDCVVQGDRLAVVEAMKMEHVLHAPASGAVRRLLHHEGDQVDMGAIILEVDMDDGDASD
jgi:3-methylcrotonyl-CoA carboxylase alpha subunit